MGQEKNMRYFLEKYGIRLKKSMGQHFLADKNIVQKEVELAEIKPYETVLEIGPGAGFLTQELLKRAKKVVAVEMDRNLAAIMEKEFAKDAGIKLEVLCEDALKADFPDFDKCVSNIPYDISAKIILKLGKYGKPAILIMQKEFAERLVAAAGSKNYSRISVMSQYYFDAKLLHIVSRNSFFPAPKVDSAIVRLMPKKGRAKAFGIKNEDFFFNVVRALFQHKNQSVRNAIIHSHAEFGLSKNSAKAVSEAVSFSQKKVRTLEIADLGKIASEILG